MWLYGSKELGQSSELDRMEREGLQLLPRTTGANTDELNAAEEILSILGNLPLAINQARAHISKRELRLRAFVTEYENGSRVSCRKLHNSGSIGVYYRARRRRFLFAC